MNTKIFKKFFVLSILIIISIILFYCNLTFSQEEGIEDVSQKDDYIKNIIGYAAFWWLAFIIGIILVIFGILLRTKFERISKLFFYGGLISVFIGMILAQILYVLPLIPVIRGIEIYTCENAANLNFIQQVACIFSGMTPTADAYAFLVWFIFLFILPLAILISLFSEFTSPLIITNPNARRVIAFASALIAYRFLMAYLFIEFISVGLGGMALFFVNILLFGWGVSGIRRLFANIEAIKKMREVQDLAQLERLMRMRDDIYAAWQAAIRTGDTQTAQQLEKRLKNIDNEIDKLRKSMEKRGEKIASIPAPS